MGLISRVSSRTYRKLLSFKNHIFQPKMFALRRFSTSAMRKADPIQSLYVSKIKEYTKLNAAGKIDTKGIDEEIAAAKARLGGEGKDMTAFPKIEFSEPDLAKAVEFKL